MSHAQPNLIEKAEEAVKSLYFQMFFKEDAQSTAAAAEAACKDICPGAAIVNLSDIAMAANEVDGVDRRETIFRMIEAQVDKMGTLDQLVFHAHGNDDIMMNIGDIDTFLEELLERQKARGGKIAKRIVFAGCETMKFTEEEAAHMVAKFRKLSAALGAEIAGTTTIEMSYLQDVSEFGERVLSSRAICFKPDGHLIRDAVLDTPKQILSDDVEPAWVEKAIGSKVSPEVHCLEGEVGGKGIHLPHRFKISDLLLRSESQIVKLAEKRGVAIEKLGFLHKISPGKAAVLAGIAGVTAVIVAQVGRMVEPHQQRQQASGKDDDITASYGR